MNKTHFFRQLVIVLFLAAFMAGCAGTQTRESTGEYMDNSVITAKVKAAILEDPMLKVFQINVETFKGEVQLSGFVDSAQAAARAVQITRGVKGVTSVKNSMVIK
ncbi:MAG: BON domain-containing protein [Desulfotignum sp.]|nr:BON domain-containing protein [Desulfotignum sp.]MCF8090306.1 BON domain-containing protein [Desulfotignum sp.]